MSPTPERARTDIPLDSVALPKRPESLELEENAKSTSLQHRSHAFNFILKNGSTLPGSTLDTIAREASYTSIGEAVLHHSEHLSYSARLALATKFSAIGRDREVLKCLGSIERQNAEGLRLYCDAIVRGRFISSSQFDSERYYFAAGLGDCSAEITWLEKFGITNSSKTDQKAAIDRLVNLASHDHNPEARVTLAQMLIDERLTSGDKELAYRSLSLAAMDGYAPAKLALLKHFPNDFRSNLRNFLADFLHAAYFPGIALCYEKLATSNELPPIVDSLLKAYLWHPHYPITTAETMKDAISAAASIPLEEMKEVQSWARGKVLVLDTTYS